MDAVLNGGSNSASWGIVCRSVSVGNNYVMGIYNDGSSYIAKSKNNRATILARGNPSTAVRKGQANNHIQGDCVGSKLTLYVNGRKLVEATDAEFGSGSVGLFGDYTAGPVTDVSFDNFLVSSP